MDLDNLLSWALGILALATAGGYGLLRGRVSALRDELRDEREGRASDRETIRDLREREEKAEGRITLLETELEAVGKVARGEAYGVAITDLLTTHHTEALGHWATIEGLVEGLVLVLKEGRDHDV